LGGLHHSHLLLGGTDPDGFPFHRFDVKIKDYIDFSGAIKFSSRRSSPLTQLVSG
jgi:hypothetical protein